MKCSLVVDGVGTIEFVSIENYIQNLQSASPHFVQKIIIIKDDDFVPAHHVCNLKEGISPSGDLFFSFFHHAPSKNILLASIKEEIVDHLKYVILINTAQLSEGTDVQTFQPAYYAHYLIELASLYSIQKELRFKRKACIFWAIQYAHRHLKAKEDEKYQIIHILKQEGTRNG